MDSGTHCKTAVSAVCAIKHHREIDSRSLVYETIASHMETRLRLQCKANVK